MAYMFFEVGDYEYTTQISSSVTDTGNVVAVRVKSSIRDTVTSLSDIPSTVTYGGVTYTVKYLFGIYPTGNAQYGPWAGGGEGWGIFMWCRQLTSLPSLPSTISYVEVDSAFKNCSALTSVPEFPEGTRRMGSTFYGCANVQDFHTIPSTVEYLNSTFYGCKQIKTAPSLPSSLVNMGYAFMHCSNLTTVASIPATVTNMYYTFYNCENLSGNVVVNNTPTSYSNIFKNTVNDIYIVNGGTAGSIWQDTIAPLYSNVHYEADDHPAPSLSSFSATRVASNGSTTPAEKGLWVYLSAQANISTEYLPVGWASEFGSTTTTMDNATITPAWTVSASTGTITLTAWVNINNLSAHTFAVTVTEDIKEGATTKKTLTTATLTATVPKAYALIDYYHDPTTGREGMAIGKYAEHADLLDVAVPSLFEDTVQVDGTATFNDDILIDLSDYQTTGSVDKELYDAIVALGWDSDVLVN